MGLIYARKKGAKPKRSLVLLTTMNYLEVLIAECDKIMSYLVSQH